MKMERQMEDRYTSTKFYDLMKSIENEQLRVCVQDSAICNAGDTMTEQGRKGDMGPAFWEVAIQTAKMILDCPKDYYPELF
jgi:hypothetical protein